MTPPMASAPYFALAAPRMISMRSTFSVPSRCSSSPAPVYFAKSPITGCPSTRIRVWRGSAPRMDTPTRPMASTVRVMPVSSKMMSSTDLACFFAMSSLVITVVDCDSDLAASLAALTLTTMSPVSTRVSPPCGLSAAQTGRLSQVKTAQASSACRPHRRTDSFINFSSLVMFYMYADMYYIL